MITELTIYDCLKLYFKEEEIDDSWKCDLCKKTSKPVKRSLKMSYSPNVLIIHMKRFTIFPRKEKIKSDLTYPEELDISRLIVGFVMILVFVLPSARMSSTN